MAAMTKGIARQDVETVAESPMCPTNCTAFHSKEEFARRISVARRTIYNYIRDGLPVGRTGRIYCPDGREWLRAKNQKQVERIKDAL